VGAGGLVCGWGDWGTGEALIFDCVLFGDWVRGGYRAFGVGVLVGGTG
jgi:hypothetical protein